MVLNLTMIVSQKERISLRFKKICQKICKLDSKFKISSRCEITYVLYFIRITTC